MKHTILTLLITTLLFACKKEVTTTQVETHAKDTYRVLVIGKSGDTAVSSAMFARTETVGLTSAEDDKLSATLIAYSNGVYTLEVVNKQACQVIIRWHWQDLTINTITPSSDVIPANSTVVFTLTGTAKPGKINLKSFGDCGNSSDLIINITEQILPINLIGNTAKYDPSTGKTTISFDIEEPQLADWIIVQKLNEQKIWQQSLLIAADGLTKKYNIAL